MIRLGEFVYKDEKRTVSWWRRTGKPQLGLNEETLDLLLSLRAAGHRTWFEVRIIGSNLYPGNLNADVRRGDVYRLEVFPEMKEEVGLIRDSGGVPTAFFDLDRFVCQR